MNSPFPFGPKIPEKPISVELNLVGRGSCVKFSYICELSQSDLEKVVEKLDSGSIGIAAMEEGQGERKKYKEFSQMKEDLAGLKPSRKIIGAITSGGYRYGKSREGGVGFVD